jgi:hypothetical protein
LRYEFLQNFPLFLCGIFLIYVGGFDEGLFRLIAFDLTNRLLVTMGTIIAATLPIFFAVGTIKQSIFTRRETIYFYEQMLKNPLFWIVGGGFCFFLAALKIFQTSYYFFSDSLVAILCCLAGTYLVYFGWTLSKKFKSK